MEPLFWGFVLRMIQASLQAAPFLFTGLCITGMLHRLLGHDHTRRLFGSNTVSSLFQSWLIGMLLPGCSLGVIPIVKQLRASGIAVGTIFAFALSSPLFDPLSMLYGLTLSKPETIMAFAACSLVVVTVCGSLFDWWFPNTEQPVPEPTPTPPGLRRLLAILVVMARESVSSTMGLIACGLVGVGVLSLFLPMGSLSRTMAHENPWSPLLMTAIAIPAYATPMTAMAQLGSMFQHGNSIGAAFILLIFGAGMNVGLMVWMARNYSLRMTAAWFGLMLLVVVALSYGIERPLYPKEIEPADHTHAFDSYCAPYASDSRPAGGFFVDIGRRIAQDTQLHEWVGATLIAGLILLGLVFRGLDRRWKIEDWLNRPQPIAEGPRRTWDVNVPGPVLAGVGFVAIIAASIVGAFAYYPSESESLEELRIAHTEAVHAALTGNKDQALYWIPLCESWNRRLMVGSYLRRWTLSDFHRMKARVFANELEMLEHLLEDNVSREAIRPHVATTSRAYGRLVRAFQRD